MPRRQDVYFKALNSWIHGELINICVRNMVSLLDKATVDAFQSTASNGGKSTVLVTSVARLYVNIGGKWKYTTIYGIIAYIMERESRVRYLRIYDLAKMTIRFQVEIPAEPTGYAMDSDQFHTLELDNEMVIGLLFAIGREKPISDDKTKTATADAKKFGEKVLQLSLKESEMKEVRETKQIQVPDSATSKRRGSSIFGMMRAVKNKFGGQTAPASVGTPTDFRHLAHIGLNADGTMAVSNVPDEWKDILKAAGISKKDFADPAINKVVVQTLGLLVPNSAGGNKGSPIPKGPAKTVLVKFSHKSATEKEVDVSDGEYVSLVKTYADGWSRVKKADGKSGMVPTNYLQEMPADDDALPTAPPAVSLTNKSDSPKHSPMPAVPRKAAAPPVPQPPAAAAAKVTNTPPPRPQPPRPGSSRPLPGAAAAAKETPVVSKQPEESVVEDDANAQSDSSRDGSQEARKPDIPRPNASLLAGIQGFNKSELAKSSDAEGEEEPSRPPVNPLLASIQSFNKVNLAKAETAPAEGDRSSGKPHPLEAIKSGNFQLKKVERTEKPTEDAKALQQPEVEGIAGLLRAKLANIRLGVKEEDEDDDDAGSDWD